MRRAGWITLALLLGLLSAAVSAVPGIKELWISKIWRLHQVDQPEGELDGIRVTVDTASAAVLEGAATDRAVIYLRLKLDGPPDRLREWVTCDLALSDDQGRRWLPLFSPAGWEIVRMLGGEEAEAGYGCNQSLTMADAGQPAISHQAFLVPTDVLDELRVELAGMTTRPDGISLPLNPVFRPLQ